MVAAEPATCEEAMSIDEFVASVRPPKLTRLQQMSLLSTSIDDVDSFDFSSYEESLTSHIMTGLAARNEHRTRSRMEFTYST